MSTVHDNDVDCNNAISNANSDVSVLPTPHTQNANNDSISTSDSQNNVNNSNKNKIHPFLIEVKGTWTELAKNISEINKIKPLVKMDGPHLKIQCKSDEDFRTTQNYLDSNVILYTTLSPQELRPRKICIRGIPVYTEPSVIINALKDKGFTANRAAMLRNRQTGMPMPIYMVNVLPRENFEEIFKITEICYISVTVEHFRGAGLVKQCRRCQCFGHASEICRLTPKCVKCAQDHLTKECPHQNKINPTCANCRGPHVASYRGCPRNPENIQKKNYNANQNKQNPNIKLNSEAVDILANFNYVKSKIPQNTPSTSKQADKYAPRPINLKGTTNKVNPITGVPEENIVINQANNATNITQPPQSNSGEINTGKQPPTPPQSDCTTDLREIFNAFKEMKDILNLNKLIRTLKKVARLVKSTTNPIDKIMYIVQALDDIFSETNIFDHE